MNFFAAEIKYVEKNFPELTGDEFKAKVMEVYGRVGFVSNFEDITNPESSKAEKPAHAFQSYNDRFQDSSTNEQRWGE